jgi:nickel/cobalt transporter (NicO) family protein
MGEHTGILILTAASVAFIHTIFGPDHYIPFIAMSKASGWGKQKIIRVTLLSGIGHILSSVVLGAAGILLGKTVFDLEFIESFRKDTAGWIMISLGLIYFIWGLKRAIRGHRHSHFHQHDDGTVHVHTHNHLRSHTHLHTVKSLNELTPWIIFTIFVFGPCEPLIPIIIYPAVAQNILLAAIVVLIFSLVTIGTMLFTVLIGVKGAGLFSFGRAEQYSHAIAGIVIMLCGASMQFLGL